MEEMTRPRPHSQPQQQLQQQQFGGGGRVGQGSQQHQLSRAGQIGRPSPRLSEVARGGDAAPKKPGADSGTDINRPNGGAGSGRDRGGAEESEENGTNNASVIRSLIQRFREQPAVPREARAAALSKEAFWWLKDDGASTETDNETKAAPSPDHNDLSTTNDFRDSMSFTDSQLVDVLNSRRKQTGHAASSTMEADSMDEDLRSCRSEDYSDVSTVDGNDRTPSKGTISITKDDPSTQSNHSNPTAVNVTVTQSVDSYRDWYPSPAGSEEFENRQLPLLPVDPRDLSDTGHQSHLSSTGEPSPKPRSPSKIPVLRSRAGPTKHMSSPASDESSSPEVRSRPYPTVSDSKMGVPARGGEHSWTTASSPQKTGVANNISRGNPQYEDKLVKLRQTINQQKLAIREQLSDTLRSDRSLERSTFITDEDNHKNDLVNNIHLLSTTAATRSLHMESVSVQPLQTLRTYREAQQAEEMERAHTKWLRTAAQMEMDGYVNNGAGYRGRSEERPTSTSFNERSAVLSSNQLPPKHSRAEASPLLSPNRDSARPVPPAPGSPYFASRSSRNPYKKADIAGRRAIGGSADESAVTFDADFEVAVGDEDDDDDDDDDDDIDAELERRLAAVLGKANRLQHSFDTFDKATGKTASTPFRSDLATKGRESAVADSMSPSVLEELMNPRLSIDEVINVLNQPSASNPYRLYQGQDVETLLSDAPDSKMSNSVQGTSVPDDNSTETLEPENLEISESKLGITPQQDQRRENEPPHEQRHLNSVPSSSIFVSADPILERSESPLFIVASNNVVDGKKNHSASSSSSIEKDREDNLRPEKYPVSAVDTAVTTSPPKALDIEDMVAMDTYLSKHWAQVNHKTTAPGQLRDKQSDLRLVRSGAAVNDSLAMSFLSSSSEDESRHSRRSGRKEAFRGSWSALPNVPEAQRSNGLPQDRRPGVDSGLVGVPKPVDKDALYNSRPPLVDQAIKLTPALTYVPRVDIAHIRSDPKFSADVNVTELLERYAVIREKMLRLSDVNCGTK
jgi:hypothetical protein